MNWFKKSQITHEPLSETNSILYDEGTFYNKFEQDLLNAKQEVIIESPFIATRRLEMLKPVFEVLIDKGVQIFIMTRDPLEHDESMSKQAEAGVRYFEVLGIQVLLCEGGHHRKLAMIDRKVLWEGSLNILSQSHSREFMRRIDSRSLTEELFKFLRFERLNIFKEKLDLL
jgi:phosphatidylserine/phosphatidylglycerophosphate/cardiolipin synthase-like enzyme